jgi:site-specific DNA-methyltransferase (adenine-specific)
VILQGDCIAVMRDILDDNTVDAIVTDPPYELGFMGKAWDKRGIAFDPATWAECLRVLKPGGHLLAFGGTRTWHRLAVAVEDAGFEIRDTIAWLYGQGFPKSLDVGKAIDKAAGATRAVVGINPRAAQQTPKPDATSLGRFAGTSPDLTAPATDAARQWQGWGTALKPAHEPIVVARKPLAGTVAVNVLAHGTGALNIDGCRIATDDTLGGGRPEGTNNAIYSKGLGSSSGRSDALAGRWPANVALDEDQAAALDEQSGNRKSGYMKPETDRKTRQGDAYGKFSARTATETYGDQGGASRFMYVAKAGANERPKIDGVAHPTVKPLALMRWLVRLITPPGGVVLDPFAGSGTTIEAAMLEGFACIGIEREATYLPLIEARIARARAALACTVHDIQRCTICLEAAS